MYPCHHSAVMLYKVWDSKVVDKVLDKDTGVYKEVP